MKKDTLYLIIAALGLYIAWRTYRLHKKNNGGGNPNPNINPNIEPINPDNPEEPNTGSEEELISVTTTEKCPYCGTPGAEVTPLAKSKSAKLVTAR